MSFMLTRAISHSFRQQIKLLLLLLSMRSWAEAAESFLLQLFLITILYPAFQLQTFRMRLMKLFLFFLFLIARKRAISSQQVQLLFRSHLHSRQSEQILLLMFIHQSTELILLLFQQLQMQLYLHLMPRLQI